MTLTRRRFIQCTAAASAATLGPPAAAQNGDTAAWIDAHVHVWTPDTKQYPLSPRFSKDKMNPVSFTDQELFGHCRPHGVERIVLIQMSFYEYDHSYMLKVMKGHPGVFSGVALVDHHSDDLVARIQSLSAQGMRGIRLHSRGDAPSWVRDPGMAQLWRAATEAKMAVCPLINPEDLPVVDALCQQHPETTVVVDHFARVGISGRIDSESLDRLCRLARFPNTHVKTSAFYALGEKAPPYEDLIPMIRRVYDSFGASRLMWASDCPFQVQGEHTYEASISLIRDRIGFLSDKDKAWMLRRTAEKVFFGT